MSSSGPSGAVENQQGVMFAVNHSSGRMARWSMASGALILTALAALLIPIEAHAQFSGKASATGVFESNSNVFAVESGFAEPGSNGRRGDTDYTYGAEFDGNYAWGRQQLYATARTSEFNYQHFTELDHNDYKVGGGLNWKLGNALDGRFDVSRTHSMVPFLDLSGSAQTLSISTEQRESLQVGSKINSSWKLVGSAFTSKTEQPILAAPNLQLLQSSGTASIDYTGVAALTSGLTVSYLKGEYSGTSGTQNPSYDQSTVGLLTNYKINRAMLEAQIGYSRRVSGTGTDSTSGITGLFDLTYKLTPKTSFTAKVDRSINSYFLNAGSEIDTEAGAGVTWQATYKLGVSLGYTFTYRRYPGQGNNPIGSDRVDIQQYATLGLDYRPERWLTIRPYANLQKRISNFIGGRFESNVFGVSFTAATPDKSRR